MNIFYLDKDPEIAAQMHCDKHVVKMILESAQMLSTAHRVLDGNEIGDSKGLYKIAHKNHPCSVWVRTCDENYEWVWNLFDNLINEYMVRYGKHHASERLIHTLWQYPYNIPVGDFTSPPQCMPDYCKEADTVSAYQTYYIEEKSDFATWKNRETPEWFNDKNNKDGIRKSTEEKRILS